MIETLSNLWRHAAAAGIALDGPFSLPSRVLSPRQRTRTGGPNDDENERLKRLMPILAAVIILAVVFGQ